MNKLKYYTRQIIGYLFVLFGLSTLYSIKADHGEGFYLLGQILGLFLWFGLAYLLLKERKNE